MAQIERPNVKSALPINDLYRPYSLQYDWITDNLYYVDQRARVIDVFNIESGHQTNIVGNDLQDPRAFTLDPTAG